MGVWLVGEIILSGSDEDVAEWLPFRSLCHANRAFPGRMAQRVEQNRVVGGTDLRAGAPGRNREISQSLAELQQEGLVLRTCHPESNSVRYLR